MKKLSFAALLLLAALLAACSQQTPSRAERSKPRVSVTSENVQLRRVPAPNADITPEGKLRIDDIEIPLDDTKRAQLQQLFGHLQMLRQAALADAPADPDMQPITVQSNPQVDALRDAAMADIPPLQPYRESFTKLQAERR
ncbi:MAG TPA: hypothetical protein VGC74_02500 [Stenotrophomonas sp.]|jgi:hypothetical protein